MRICRPQSVTQFAEGSILLCAQDTDTRLQSSPYNSGKKPLTHDPLPMQLLNRLGNYNAAALNLILEGTLHPIC